MPLLNLPSPEELLNKVKDTVSSFLPTAEQRQAQSAPRRTVSASMFSSTPSTLPSPQDLMRKISAASTLPSPQELMQRISSSSTTRPQKSQFVQSLERTTQSGVRKVASAGDEFLAQQARNIGDAATGRIVVTPADLLQGIKQTASGTANGIGFLAKGFNEGIVRIVKSGSEIALGKDRTEQIGSNPVLKRFSADITGRDSISTYQDIYGSARSYARENKATDDEARTFAGMAVLGMLFADNPISGPGKAGIELSEAAVEELAKETSEDTIKTIIRGENPGIQDSALDAITPGFKRAQTPEEVRVVRDYVNRAKDVSETFKRDAPAKEDPAIVAKTDDLEVVPGTKPQDAEEAAERYWMEKIQPVAQGGDAVIIGADDLKAHFGEDYDPARHPVYSRAAYLSYLRALQETKGDTVRVVAGGTGSGKTETLTKALSPNFDGIIYESTLTSYESAVKLIGEARKAGKEVEVYGIIPDLELARYFTLARGERTGRMISAEDFARTHSKGVDTLVRLAEDGEHVTIRDTRGITTPDQIRNADLAKVYTGTKALDQLKKSLYTESEIYERIKDTKLEGANGRGKSLPDRAEGSVPTPRGDRPDTAGESTEAGGGEPVLRSEGGDAGLNYSASFSPNVIKKLGESKDALEVAGVLREEFPGLPDLVIDRLVRRFVRTKRIQNVEALLRVARGIEAQLNAGASSRARAIASKASTLPQSPEVLPQQTLGSKAEQILDSTTTPQQRAGLTQSQKVSYISNLTRRFDDPKEAVMAEHEYDRMWDSFTRDVMQEYADISMQKSFLEDVLAADDEGIYFVYKKLFMGPNKKNAKALGGYEMELQEIHNRASKKKKAIENYRRFGSSGDKKYPGNPGKLTKTEEYAVELDVWIKEAGYDDWEAAQNAIERYGATKREVERLAERLKELKPHVQEAKIIQESLEDFAIIPEKEVSTIDRLTDAAVVRDDYTDISGFASQARDLYRNFEKFFGNRYAEVKKAILDPFDDAKGRFVDTIKSLGDGLEESVVKKFNVKRGSKESAYIMRYGEGNMTYDSLVKEVGVDRAEEIVKAAGWFREQYDRLIDELNEVRKKIYPNNPSKLISHRKDYFRHFQDLGEGFQDALREFFETPSGIDPQLVGISEFTRAKTRHLSFAEQRKGDVSAEDAVGGFIDYIPLFAYAKEIDPQIQSFRYLRRRLGEAAPRAGEDLKLPDGSTYRHKGIENFLTFLDDFQRDLTGNTNPMDRYLLKIVPGGRRTMRAMRFINNRMKANTIGGNLGSAVAQLANVPVGIASAKQYSVPGMQRALASITVPDDAMAKSTFLKERFMVSVADRFPFEFSDRPVRASADKARKWGRWILGKTDQLGTTFIWSAHYEKALAEGIDEPVRYADAETRKLVAGRGIGEVPLGQKALATQFIAPFQVEVGNLWWIMKDFVDRKDFPALAVLLLGNYLFNEAAEQIRGSRVAFDPINSLVEGSQSLIEEWDAGEPGRGTAKFLGRQVGEILANVPYGQTFAAAIPEKWVADITGGISGAPMSKQEIFGDSPAGRFGTPLIVSGDLEDTLYRILPPIGGKQIQKMVSGVEALLSGTAEDSKGNTTFSISRTPQNVARALLFGANATSDARKYFEERSDLFNRVNRQEAEGLQITLEGEKEWADIKKMLDRGDKQQAVEALKRIDQENPRLGDRLAQIAEDEKKGLNSNDRLIKMLQVQNGERAKYIVSEIRQMKKEERIEYLENLDRKGLISDTVFDQILALMEDGG